MSVVPNPQPCKPAQTECDLLLLILLLHFSPLKPKREKENEFSPTILNLICMWTPSVGLARLIQAQNSANYPQAPQKYKRGLSS